RPGSDREQVLLLEAGVALAAAVPLVAESVQRRRELRLAAGPARVRVVVDARRVVGPEVPAVVVRVLEGGDLEHLALERAELDAVAEQCSEVLLAAPERRGAAPPRRARGGGGPAAA